MPELLSPAGSLAALEAALKAGADAVYLGLKEFSARAGAENFTRDEYRAAKIRCAAAGVKVYVTLNTLLTDRQLPEMEDTIRFLADAGCDGIIVQDLATAALARKMVPALPLHASTQMCIYNLDGARLLETLGFSRVVLARELSINEIIHITRNTTLETEVFVHGALCMSYSGHCYFSSVIGRNSGNRGRCAQPCRLPYEGGYPLSLKDLSLLSETEALILAGVSSLKIEGRLKSPEYVGGVTRAFANALRGQAPEENTIVQLSHLFSRDGFTDGYFKNRLGREMFGIKQPTAYNDYRTAVQALTRHKPISRFPLSLTLDAFTDQECKWTFSDGQNRITLSSPPAAPAENKPLTEVDLFAKLDKLQDTFYFLDSCLLKTDEAIFLPVSLINEMRRTALEELDALRSTPAPLPLSQAEPLSDAVFEGKGGLQIHYLRKESFAKAVDHSIFRVVWLPPEATELYDGQNRGVHIDHFYPDDKLEALFDKLWQQGIRRVLIGNLGHILPARRRGFEIWGDYALNLTNSRALAEAKALGLQNATLSFELSLPQIRDLRRTLATSLIVYGRLPLMMYKNCIIKQKGRCIDGKGFAPLRDRKGAEFLLACRPDCGNALYNSLPLLLESVDVQPFPDIDKRFNFTDESPARVAEIIQNYICGKHPDGSFTGGLYKRGVI